MSSSRPQLNDYELMLQLGHTTDYQIYLVRKGSDLFTLRQSRKERDGQDTETFEGVLGKLRGRGVPCLPRVSDVGVEDDRLFWVSAYSEGDLLDSLGKRSSQVPSDVAVRISLDVALALQGLTALGHSGPVLRQDVHVGLDGVAQVVPPLSWDGPPRRDLAAVAASLPRLPREVVYVCAFLWESISGLALSACREGEGWPLVSTLGASPSPALDALLSDVLHARARFERVETFASVIEQSAGSVASREEVREWLLTLTRARLESRAHVLRSRLPVKPSGEIPLVQVPANLDGARFATRVGAADVPEGLETERPAALPTLLTPQPFPHEAGAPSAPPSSIRASGGAEPGAPSSAPPSSIRTTHTPVTPSDGKVRRAPLESALAELIERNGARKKP